MIAALLVLSGCATSGQLQDMERQTSSINSKMREMNGNLDDINFSLKAQTKNGKDAADRLAAMEKDVKDMGADMAVIKRNQADLGSRMSTGGETASFGGQIDELRHDIETTNAKLDALKATLLQKLSAIEAAQAGQGAAGTTGAATDGQATTPAPDAGNAGGEAANPPPVGDPIQVYQAAYLDYTKGSFELALQGFRDYLRAFPDAEFAGNAQYWVGESLYSLHRYEDAVVEFQKVIDNFPESNKLPGAMLKKGYSYDALGKPDEEKAVLTTLIAKYPESEAAKLAAERLKPKTRGNVVR